MIKVRFSAARPAGPHCLILPVAKDGLATAAVPGDAAMVQAAACTADACWSVQWGEEAGLWRATCSQGATLVEWTWIAPTR